MVAIRLRLALDRSRTHHGSLFAFAAVMALFGVALFPLYGYPASGEAPLAGTGPLAAQIAMVRSIPGACERTGLGLVYHGCHDWEHDCGWCGQPGHGVARDELWTGRGRAAVARCGTSY